MSVLSRRSFMARSTAVIVGAALPIPKAMALVATEGPPLRWHAVGNDEFSYSFLAENAEAARREYAWVHGATVSEECPECGEYQCHAHNEDLDAPLDWVEVNHVFDESFTPDNEPKMVDWARAGFNVPCEGCDFHEPIECYEFEGLALCDQCIDSARAGKLSNQNQNAVKPQEKTPENSSLQ